MSTKYSLKYGSGYHLYEDVVDTLRAPGHPSPVYLELHGCDIVDLCASGDAEETHITVCMRREIAEALGLVPAEAASDG